MSKKMCNIGYCTLQMGVIYHVVGGGTPVVIAVVVAVGLEAVGVVVGVELAVPVSGAGEVEAVVVEVTGVPPLGVEGDVGVVPRSLFNSGRVIHVSPP